MPIRFHCEFCDAKIKVPGGSHGRRVKCPRCGQTNTVPGVDAQTAAAMQLAQSEAPNAGDSDDALATTDRDDEPIEAEQSESSLFPADDQLPHGASMALANLAGDDAGEDDMAIAYKPDEPDDDSGTDEPEAGDTHGRQPRAAGANEAATVASAEAAQSPDGPLSVHHRPAEKPVAIPLTGSADAPVRPKTRDRPRAKPMPVPPARGGAPSPIQARSLQDIPPAKRPLPPSAKLSAEPDDWRRSASDASTAERATSAGSTLLADLGDLSTSTPRSRKAARVPNYTGLVIAAWMLRICGMLILAPIYFRHFSGEPGENMTTAIVLTAIEAVVAVTVLFALSEGLDVLRDMARNSHKN